MTSNTELSSLFFVDLSLIQTLAIYALPVVIAITRHEAAHGYVAKRLCDLTAYAAGLPPGLVFRLPSAM